LSQRDLGKICTLKVEMELGDREFGLERKFDSRKGGFELGLASYELLREKFHSCTV